MLNTPTEEQINAATSWKSLYEALGLKPNNDRACRKVQRYVREHWPNSHLERRGTMGVMSDTDFATLVSNCLSKREVITRGGWRVAGSSYTMVNERIARLQLDTSHMLGMGANKNKAPSNKKSVYCYLVEAPCSIGSAKLKKRLWSEGLKEKICEICKIDKWLNKPAPLQLDHINGNKNDNRLENLRILCANCHALTPTHSKKKR